MMIVLGLTTGQLLNYNTAARASNDLFGFASLIEVSRQTAVTLQTYTWLAFGEGPDNGTQAILIVSQTGANEVPWGSNPFEISDSSDLQVRDRLHTFNSLRIGGEVPASVSEGQPSDLPQSTVFTWKSGHSGLLTFDRVIQFSPSGQVRIGPSHYPWFTFALEMPQGASSVPVGVLKLWSVSGKTQVIR